MTLKCSIAGRCGLVLFAVLAATLPASSATPAANPPHSGKSASEEDFRSHMRAAAETLQKGWLISMPSGAQSWGGINAWQRFVIVDALVRYTEQSGDRRYLSQIQAAVQNHDGLDGNDDDLWAVIASLHVYRLERSPALLAFSRAKFSELTDRYWDQTCGGGMWWDHQRTYKNAITNELLLYAATALHRATGDPSYAAWAQKEWAWFSHSGMINSDHLVNDGLNRQCRNNGSATYTYNQGVLLGGLVNLYAIDGDSSHLQTATAIAQAAIQRLTVHGILEEPTASLNQDGQTFKGVFVSYLGDLVPLVADRDVRKTFADFLAQNAEAVWRRRAANHQLDAYWTGAAVEHGAAAQAAALSLFSAASYAGTAVAKPSVAATEKPDIP